MNHDTAELAYYKQRVADLEKQLRIANEFIKELEREINGLQ